MKRRNALLAESRRTRASLLLEMASKKKPIGVIVHMTPYKNSKGRSILQLIRTTYVVRNGSKTIYGLKAHSPLHLLAHAPRAIRPRRRT